MLDSLLKTKSSLLLFIILTSIYGWGVKFWLQKTVTKYNPLIIVIVEIIIVFLLLTSIIFATKSHTQIKKELNNILVQDYLYLSIIGFFGLIITYLGTTVFLHHKAEDIEKHEFIITMLINTIVIYLFTNKQITRDVFIGLCLVAVGGYMIVK